MKSSQFSQELNPVELLSQVIGYEMSGCLQVFNSPITWSIYVEKGQLLYASNSNDPFSRLQRYLYDLNFKASNSEKLFELIKKFSKDYWINQSKQSILMTQNSDYLAICWLVRQQYLNSTQASLLVGHLA
jgi:twitching motility two-component system response regulator PilG